jgi:aryl-alcohol dehydrogenase-like predicted oxidoreductase
MEQRGVERLGRTVSVAGLGTWQLGADRGEVAEEAAGEVLDGAAAHGITFFHTADVDGDGRNPEQVAQDAAAAALAPLRDEPLDGVREIYDRLIRPHMHHRW